MKIQQPMLTTSTKQRFLSREPPHISQLSSADPSYPRFPVRRHVVHISPINLDQGLFLKGSPAIIISRVYFAMLKGYFYKHAHSTSASRFPQHWNPEFPLKCPIISTGSQDTMLRAMPVLIGYIPHQ